MTKDSNNQTPSNADSTETLNNSNPKKKKKGMFRAIGALPFFAVTTALSASVYLFTAPALKYAIVYGAEKATGAETNVEDVIVQWHPFAIKVIGFQQTDPNKNSHNLLAFQRAAASINLLELLLGKTIIEQLAIEQLTFDSARKSSGQIYRAPADDTVAAADPEQNAEASADSGDSSFSIPSSEELLQRVDLQTVQKGQQLQQVWQTEQRALQQAYDELPDKSALEKYESQWQAIKKSNIESLQDLKDVQEKLKTLKSDLKKDQQALSAVKQQYQLSKSQLDIAYKELKAAPEQDWQTIQQTLPIQDTNAVAISQLLFGEEIANYVASAQEYWQKAQPYIEKYRASQPEQPTESIATLKQGRDITFALDTNYPDFLIKGLSVSIEKQIDNQVMQFTLAGSDITHQSYIIDKPSELTLTYIESELDGEQQPFITKASVYTNQSNHSKIDGTWSMRNKPLAKQTLISDGDMNLSLNSAKLSGQGTFQYDSELTSQHQFDFKQTQFDGTGNSELSDITIEALTPVQEFNLQVALNGQLSKPDAKITSNLDNQLRSAFKQALSARWESVKQDTQTQLQQTLQSQLNVNNKDLQKLDNWQSELNKAELELNKYSEDNLDKLLAEKTAQQQANVQRKLDEEKRKLEEKAEKEKQRAKDKLKDKLKGKLKDLGL